MQKLIGLALFAVSLFMTPCCLAQVAFSNLVANGHFESGQDGEKPDDWALGAGATWEKDGDNHFLRLKSPRPGANVMVYRAVPLTQDVKALELSYKVRYEGIAKGKQAWFDGRIIMNFKDSAKKTVDPSPPPPVFTGTAKDWKAKMQQFKVPAGAVMIELMFTLFQPESGQVDFDDIKLTPISADIIDAAEAAEQAKDAARIAALPKPKPQVPAPSPEQLPKPLHVAGNQLQTPDGKPVWLQDLAVPSMEWSAGGRKHPQVHRGRAWGLEGELHPPLPARTFLDWQKPLPKRRRDALPPARRGRDQCLCGPRRLHRARSPRLPRAAREARGVLAGCRRALQEPPRGDFRAAQ